MSTNTLWDRNEVLRWTYALGKKPAELHLRTFDKQKNPLKHSAAGLKDQGDIWYAQQHGVYVVVNDGGQEKADITEVRALFAEHDDMAKQLPEFASFSKEAATDEEYLAYSQANKRMSHELVEALVADGKLPKPTMCVDTGGKSLHWYWRLTAAPEGQDRATRLSKWRELQERLIALLGSDSTIKDLPRIMRLPGFVHERTGQAVSIVQLNSDLDENLDVVYAEYSMAEFDELLPKPTEKVNHPCALDETIKPKKASGRTKWFELLDASQQVKCIDVMLKKIVEIHGRPAEGNYPGHEICMQALPGIFRYYSDRTIQENYEFITNFFEWRSDKYPGFDGFKKWCIGLKVGGYESGAMTIGTTIGLAYSCGFDKRPWLDRNPGDEKSAAVIVADQLYDFAEPEDRHIITLPDGLTYTRVPGAYHYQKLDVKKMEAAVAGWLMTNMPKSCRDIAAIVKCIKQLTFKDAEQAPVSPDGYLNFTNGVLRIKAGAHKLLSHFDPEVADMVFLDEPACAFDPNADRTYARDIMSGLEHDEAREIWLRVASQALDVTNLHGTPVALINIGAGGNGKDVCVDALRHIFGASEATGIDLADLAKAGDAKQGNGTIALLPLQHSRFNCPPETATNMKLNHVATLKTVITQEKIKARNHFEGFSEFYPRAIHMFSVNEELLLDNTDAMARRLRAVRWPYVFKFEQDYDPNNPRHKKAVQWYRPSGRDAEGIRKVKELICPGFVLELLDAYDRYMGVVPSDMGPGIPRKYSDSVLTEMRETTDHVRRFISDQGFVSTTTAYSANSLAVSNLWRLYKLWCLENDRAELFDGNPLGNPEDNIRLTGVGHGDGTIDTAFRLAKRVEQACMWTTGKPGGTNKHNLKNANYFKHIALPEHLAAEFHNRKED